MKQKLQDKKGFTLVELMIVVVIMGILVAVAIPIYNSATKNTKVKSCASNIRVIEENLSSYIMTGNAGGEFTYAQLTASDSTTTGSFLGTQKSSANWPTEFKATFKGSEPPKCPFDKNAGYTITFYKGQDNAINYLVTCDSEKTVTDAKGTKPSTITATTDGAHAGAVA